MGRCSIAGAIGCQSGCSEMQLPWEKVKRAGGVLGGGWELTGSAAVLRLRILCARQELGVLNKRVGLAQI